MATVDRKREARGLEVQLEQEGDRVLVRAWGELDQDSAGPFETELRRAIREGALGVDLDLDGVTFIDSIGLRVLISAAMMSHAGRREFIVLRASEQVQHVIETSGVEDLLPLAD
jgi:anti-anti-sigma factor